MKNMQIPSLSGSKKEWPKWQMLKLILTHKNRTSFENN